MSKPKKLSFWNLSLPFKKDNSSKNFNIKKIIDTLNPLSVVHLTKKEKKSSILSPPQSEPPKIKCIETKLPYVLRRNL